MPSPYDRGSIHSVGSLRLPIAASHTSTRLLSRQTCILGLVPRMRTG